MNKKQVEREGRIKIAKRINSLVLVGTLSCLSAVCFAQDVVSVSTDISEDALLQAFLGEKKIQTRGSTKPSSESITELKDICTTKPRLRVSIPFASNSAVIPANDQPFITHVANVLINEKLAKCQVLVEGHTDAKGKKQHNLQLSAQRAESIIAELIKQGVPKEQLLGAGFGSDELVNSNDPNDGVNRRVEFLLYQ